MAFTDSNGITDLPTARKRERLSISYDTKTQEFAGLQDKDTFAVLLYVPDKGDPGHEHIELTDEAARKLHEWLTEYLTARRVLP